MEETELFLDVGKKVFQKEDQTVEKEEEAHTSLLLVTTIVILY
jgi:hypothetical protein